MIQDTGPFSARVELHGGTVVRRHHDQFVTRPAGDPSSRFPASVLNPLVDPGFFVHDENSPEITREGRE